MSEYYLMHSGRSKRDGAKIGSGRYRLGSGNRPYQATGGKPRSKNSRKRPEYISYMSDKDMQDAIKRENLENTYAKTFDLINDPKSRAEGYTKAAKDAISSAKKLEKATRKKPKPLDLSNMSNEELQRQITRANLERQYNQLFNSEEQNISKGRRRVQKLINGLDLASDILAPFIVIGATYLGYRAKQKGVDLFPWR